MGPSRCSKRSGKKHKRSDRASSFMARSKYLPIPPKKFEAEEDGHEPIKTATPLHEVFKSYLDNSTPYKDIIKQAKLPRKMKKPNISISAFPSHGVGVEIHQQSSHDHSHYEDPQSHDSVTSDRLTPSTNISILGVTPASSTSETRSIKSISSPTHPFESGIAPGPERRGTEVHIRQTNRQLGDYNDMVVKKVVFGDGSKGKDGRYLEKGYLYAAPNLQGGIESYHRVDETSLELFEHNGLILEYNVLPDSPLTKSFHDRPIPRGPNITVSHSRPLSKESLHREILKWLRKNPGYSLVIEVPEAREVTDSTRYFRLPEIRLEMADNSGNCLIAAIVNGISALRGSYSATYAKQALLGTSLMGRSLGSMTRPIQMLGLGVDLRRAEGKSKPIADMANNNSQVLLVRMIEGNRLDHVICIDSSHRLILDGAEPCALRLSKEALKALGTQNGRKVRIAEKDAK